MKHAAIIIPKYFLCLLPAKQSLCTYELDTIENVANWLAKFNLQW